jgi:polyhydroxyalkanoate synthase subunit PhaC
MNFHDIAQLNDEARRQIGRALDAIGLGPHESPHRVIADLSAARLRAYQDAECGHGPVVLIIPAPFKRAYIWDLLPQVSVVRRCVERGLRTYLLEWLIPTAAEDKFGLAEYANALPRAALDAIASETGCQAALLFGHSLGGTFAAIFASLSPERVSGLALVDAPLAFGKHGGPLARAVALAPHARAIRQIAGSPLPGTIMDALVAGTVPEAFQLQRFSDLAASMFDPMALAIHARVERWAYDEFPMPGQLFEDTLEQLYRHNRFFDGTLRVGEQHAGVAHLRSAVMAVLNPVGRIVPPRSILDGLEAAQPMSLNFLEYGGDHGPMLQHLGSLVSPLAHAQLWPKILDWATEVSQPNRSRLLQA